MKSGTKDSQQQTVLHFCCYDPKMPLGLGLITTPPLTFSFTTCRARGQCSDLRGTSRVDSKKDHFSYFQSFDMVRKQHILICETTLFTHLVETPGFIHALCRSCSVSHLLKTISNSFMSCKYVSDNTMSFDSKILSIVKLWQLQCSCSKH